MRYHWISNNFPLELRRRDTFHKKTVPPNPATYRRVVGRKRRRRTNHRSFHERTGKLARLRANLQRAAILDAHTNR